MTKRFHNIFSAILVVVLAIAVFLGLYLLPTTSVNADSVNAEEPPIISTGSYSYSLTLQAQADKDTIWMLWEDVENWKSYDTVLQYSYLLDDADFAVGAIGYVKARGAPKTKFELISVDAGNAFVESLKLPLWNTLELKRRVTQIDEKTVAFTHEVDFKGPLKGLMYFFLAKRFKKDLRLVMTNMQALAEGRPISEGLE